MPKTAANVTARTWRALTATAKGVRASRTLALEYQDGREFQLAGKVNDELVVVKLWSSKGWTCDLFFIDIRNGLVVANARAETEAQAWKMCVEEANERGYEV